MFNKKKEHILKNLYKKRLELHKHNVMEVIINGIKEELLSMNSYELEKQEENGNFVLHIKVSIKDIE